MKNKVSIETERYDSIVGGIKAAATDCTLNDNDFLAYENTKGTTIAEFLSHRADRVCELTKKYQMQSSEILVDRLNQLKEDIVETDIAAAENIRVRRGMNNIEQ